MRCPKCGYISFDNVESCLKCNKNIAEATKAFQGSTLNVTIPTFLRFSSSEEDDEINIDESEDMGGDIDFNDPDLEILVDDDDEDEEDGIAFNLSEEETEVDLGDEVALAEEFGEMETFGEDEEAAQDDVSVDLGQFEDASEEDTFEFSEAEKTEETSGVNLEFPEELADISDLSAPNQAEKEEPPAVRDVKPETEEAVLAAEPEDDLDFSNLDMEFDLDGLDEPLAAPVEISDDSEAGAKKPRTRDATDMDADLNFDLDLGGLSIHDEK